MAKKKRARRLNSPAPEFREISLRAGVVKAMTAALGSQNRLQFAVKWVTQQQLVLISLEVKGADGLFHQLLDHPLADNDGEIVHDMGLFSPGSLTIRFRIGSLGTIPKVATVLIENEQKVTPFKPGPNQPPKSLKQGETWKETGPFTVGTTR